MKSRCFPIITDCHAIQSSRPLLKNRKGVSARWADANISREAADAYLNELFANERCRVCGSRPDEVDSFIQDGSAWICLLHGITVVMSLTGFRV